MARSDYIGFREETGERLVVEVLKEINQGPPFGFIFFRKKSDLLTKLLIRSFATLIQFSSPRALVHL